MVSKKRTKGIIAFALSLTLLASGATSIMSASASGIRTKAEKFGEDSYKNMFLSMYDDVITNGVENGYLSGNNVPSGGFGVPYHAVETFIVEAPDYGHETTSEAMSYIVWAAAMRDNLDGKSQDLPKAWKTLEVMIPTEQSGFMTKTAPSATYSDELDTPEEYPKDMLQGNTGENPIHKNFCSAYSGDKGLYLLHWLGDVDNWYGYGSGKTFTFINTFQRGRQESCFETVPHPSIEKLEYGNSTKGLKGVFSTEATIAKQWAYTNAPDAEERAIQAVYWANRWGVGNSDVTSKAGKMADQLRNDMFDKYYKKISKTTKKSDSSAGYDGAHYLMAWYTSWGGALDGSWTWQIGCSHSHEFYQNVMCAYGMLNDSALKSAMKAEGAVKDWTTSFERQLEMYEWLQSADGPIAGGCTNSWDGRYETYGSNSTFYEMAYLEHPVYNDPGSNHWIGNQVWAVQRIAELYYVAKTDGDSEIASRCKAILDKWVEWFIDNMKYNDEAMSASKNDFVIPYAMPARLEWSGEPDTWTGTKSSNSSLRATITDWGFSDVGCVSSLANTLLYYAAGEGVKDGSTGMGAEAFNVAKTLIDAMWSCYRDDIGISYTEHNGSLGRVFTEDVWVPTNYTGTMPNGDQIKNGIKFIDIRTMYKDDPMYAPLKAASDDNNGDTSSVDLKYHRFWHAGDALMAIGTMAELFPEAEPALLNVTKSDAESNIFPEVKVPDDLANFKGGDPTSTVKYGDINLDGNVTAADVITFTKHFLGTTLKGDALINADVTGDGQVALTDLATLKQFVVGDNVGGGRLVR